MRPAVNDHHKEFLKQEARGFAARWARRHPRHVAKAAGAVAAHPVRTVRIASGVRQAADVARDPRTAPAASAGASAIRGADRSALADPELWRALGDSALTLAAVYTEARRRRARRRLIGRVLVTTVVVGVAAGVVVRLVTSRTASGT
jgi:hypothetical protein